MMGEMIQFRGLGFRGLGFRGLGFRVAFRRFLKSNRLKP